MLRIYLVIGIISFSTLALSQQLLKPFRVALGIGYANGGGYTSAGIFGTIEPGYRITDRILAGARFELAGIARGDVDRLNVNFDILRIFSYGANLSYYFEGDIVRPLIGAGVSAYDLEGTEYRVDFQGPAQSTGDDTKFGFYPRIGVELGHLTFIIDYNFVARTKIDAAEFKNNYLAIRLGFFVGGGKKSSD
jgi:hypothetical protein